MRKSTIASIASFCMLPALFWSQDSSAVPAFARKYQTSCYTCHSGFPNRNAFGEAFKNNGYRWPGGEEEDHAKQEQTKMGGEGWKKIFPESPWPTDIPGFAPFALYVTGPLVNYADQVKTSAGKVTAQQTFYQGGPIDARILFGGTIGENIGVVGAFEGFAANSVRTNLRATWSFAPGINVGFGNGFSAWTGAASPISVYTSVFPTSGTSTELNYVTGKEGGFNLIAGIASATTATATIPTIDSNKIDDTRYVRAKYKLFGAGLLSGAGGVYGNEYVGLDNSLAIGAGFVSAGNGVLASNYKGETFVYGADIAGNYGNFTAGVAYTKDSDLKLNNYAVDAGYYVYPWLLTRVRYANLGVAGVDQNNPTVTPSVTAWLRANVSLAASYKLFTKSELPTSTTGENNKNTFTLTGAFAF
ncbi:MAG: hypothetical protein WCL43_02455 [Chlorobium sp.]|jgi:hypothetical protein|nr:MAG: hypothetical protein FDX12_08230 [Chlorobium sp.]